MSLNNIIDIAAGVALTANDGGAPQLELRIANAKSLAVIKTEKTSNVPVGGKLSFETNNGIEAKPQMIIDSQGRIGIGTQEPQFKLHVDGDARFKGPLTIEKAPLGPSLTILGATRIGEGPIEGSELLAVGGDVMVTGKLKATTFTGDGAGLSNVTPANGSVTAAKLANGSVTREKLDKNFTSLSIVSDGAINSTRGLIGIGLVPSILTTFLLDVAGKAHATKFEESSDARFKTKATQLSGVLEKLKNVRGVSFEWNELYGSMGRSTGEREIGVIAQEVEAVFPELVTEWGEEKYKALAYGRLSAVLLEAVKELTVHTETLAQRVQELETAHGKGSR